MRMPVLTQLIIWGLLLVYLLTSCSPHTDMGGPDMEPVGSGLRFIGVGLVVMALVFVFAQRR